MPRPCCRRRINQVPSKTIFKPSGGRACDLEWLTITFDEIEALRLADMEGAYQEIAAESMGISRPTFARIIQSARRKVAEALVLGKALLIDGGTIEVKTNGKGEGDMPNLDGTGPEGIPRAGRGRGPCGCGQRRGGFHRQGRGGAGRRDKSEFGVPERQPQEDALHSESKEKEGHQQ